MCVTKSCHKIDIVMQISAQSTRPPDGTALCACARRTKSGRAITVNLFLNPFVRSLSLFLLVWIEIMFGGLCFPSDYFGSQNAIHLSLFRNLPLNRTERRQMYRDHETIFLLQVYVPSHRSQLRLRGGKNVKLKLHKHFFFFLVFLSGLFR